MVETVIEPAAQVHKIELKEFQPRPAKKKRDSGTRPGGQKRRYSPESRKVGEVGDRAVIRYEKERLIELGRAGTLPIAFGVMRNSGSLVGWDITSFDDDGNEVFIEAKASGG